jgi:hypothetical protein
MNGDRAEKQIQRIRGYGPAIGFVMPCRSTAGELDSVHLYFYCRGERYPVPWVGAWLETLTPEELWRQLETKGAIKQPAA